MAAAQNSMSVKDVKVPPIKIGQTQMEHTYDSKKVWSINATTLTSFTMRTERSLIFALGSIVDSTHAT